MNRSQLQRWCDDVGLAVGTEAWSRLERLLGLWRQYGRAINLVGATEPEVLLEHVQEALQGVALVERASGGREVLWLDVGSGGGLPGLVVAAVREWEVILVEPRARRAAFLDLGLSSTGIGAARVIRGRWPVSTWNAKLSCELESRFETMFVGLSSRATFPPENWLRAGLDAGISRGMVVCHVDSGVTEVAGEKPSSMVAGPRWSVLGFHVGLDPE
ncbi:MAG: RsmG family class I SAM-dependent methyltransferase [Nannocystaceae bacterium]